MRAYKFLIEAVRTPRGRTVSAVRRKGWGAAFLRRTISRRARCGIAGMGIDSAYGAWLKRMGRRVYV